MRRALRRILCLYIGCGGKTASKPNGGKGLPRSILSVRVRFFELQQVLRLAYLLGRGFAGALSATAQGEKVKGALRAALIGDAPGLGEAALGEHVETRLAVMGDKGSTRGGDLRCG